MNNFKRFGGFLSADLYKIKHLKSIIISPIVMFLLIILQYSLLWIQDAQMSGASIPPEIMATMYSGKSMLFGSSSYIMFGLFTAIMSAILIGSDFREGTMKTLVARGADRMQVYFSKWLTIVIITCCYILGAFLVCGILTAITGYDAKFTGEEFGLLIRSLVLQLWVGIASSSIYVLIAFLTRSQGTAIGVSLGLYFISGIVVTILILIATLTNTEWLANVGDFLPSQQLSVACSYDKYTDSEIVKVVLIPFAYIVLTCGIGVFSFMKRDIK